MMLILLPQDPIVLQGQRCVLDRLRTVFSHTNFSHFNKKAHQQIPHILPHRPNINITPFHTKSNF